MEKDWVSPVNNGVTKLGLEFVYTSIAIAYCDFQVGNSNVVLMLFAALRRLPRYQCLYYSGK